MANDPVTGIAGAIEQGFKLLAQILSGAGGRRTRRAINAGENYIRRNNRLGRKTDKLLDKYEKIFWKNNN